MFCKYVLSLLLSTDLLHFCPQCRLLIYFAVDYVLVKYLFYTTVKSHVPLTAAIMTAAWIEPGLTGSEIESNSPTPRTLTVNLKCDIMLVEVKMCFLAITKCWYYLL
jgi:hypothetical protein